MTVSPNILCRGKHKVVVQSRADDIWYCCLRVPLQRNAHGDDYHYYRESCKNVSLTGIKSSNSWPTVEMNNKINDGIKIKWI